MAWLEREPSGHFHVRFRIGTRKFKRSLKTKSESAAETRRVRLEGVLGLLSCVDWLSCTCQPSEHQLDHCNVNHGFTCVGEIFVVLAQPPISSQPTESSFHHPTSGQHFESRNVIASFDDFQYPAGQIMEPIDQLSCIAAVGPDQTEAGKTPLHFLEHEFGAVPVLDICGVNDHGEHQSHHIDEDVTLATVDLLARVVSMRPPFSVVFTDWLSMIPALGSSSRPARFLTSRRRTS